jgi:hypothetical protein
MGGIVPTSRTLSIKLSQVYLDGQKWDLSPMFNRAATGTYPARQAFADRDGDDGSE